MKKNPFNLILNVLTFVIDFIIVRHTAGSCWYDAMPGVGKFVTSSKLVALCGNNRFIAAALVGSIMGLIYLAIRLLIKDEEGKDELAKDLIASSIMFILLIVFGMIISYPIRIVY